MPRLESRLLPKNLERIFFALDERRPLSAALNTHAAREEYQFDMHYELEFGLVFSGEMRREYENSERTVRPGDVWLCGIWEPHGYRIVKAPCRVLVLVLRPEMLVNTRFDEAPEFRWLAPFAAPPEQRPVLPPAQRIEMLALGRRFTQTFGLQGQEQALAQRLLLLEMLLLLSRGWAPPASAGVPVSYHALINKAVQMVFGQRRMLTAAEAARACGLSRNRFDEVFQRLIGLSFARFALRYRLGGAAAQLLRSEDAVKKVAADWGFTDASHLHRCFEQHYGCSPAAYRKRPALQAGPARLPSGTPLMLSPDGAPSGPSTVAWNVPKGQIRNSKCEIRRKRQTARTKFQTG